MDRTEFNHLIGVLQNCSSTYTGINISTGKCPWCGHSAGSNTPNFAFPFGVQMVLTTEQEKELSLHILQCTMKIAEKLNIDIDDILSKGQIIHRVEKEDDHNPTNLYEEGKFEMDEDSEMEDLEDEIKDLEEDSKRVEELTSKTNQGDVILKFKFMNGMSFEGGFKSCVSLGEVVEWLALKSGVIKEMIGLRINNQIFENRKVLESKSTLEDLKIANNSEIVCLVRRV